MPYTVGVEANEMKNLSQSHMYRKGYVIALLCLAAGTIAAFVAYLLTGVSLLWLASLVGFIASSWTIFHLRAHEVGPKEAPAKGEPRREEDDLLCLSAIDDD